MPRSSEDWNTTSKRFGAAFFLSPHPHDPDGDGDAHEFFSTEHEACERAEKVSEKGRFKFIRLWWVAPSNHWEHLADFTSPSAGPGFR
jgi:hypothetical protein